MTIERKSVRGSVKDMERGDTATVAFRDRGPVAEVTGTVEAIYSESKFAVQLEGKSPDGKAIVVTEDAVRVGSFADGMDTDMGRPVYVTVD